jgi:protein SCO1/2
MIAMLLIVWRDAVREGFVALWRTPPGRALVGFGTAAVLGGLALAAVRVRDAVAAPGLLLGDGLPATRLNKVAPALELRNQRGEIVNLARFRGRPVVLTFGYGHCETVCPVVVDAGVQAVSQTRDLSSVLVVVTLDPWRDTPARLGRVAEQWHLPAGAQLLGGEPDEVEAALDRWQVARIRDPDTGAITHATPVFLIDRDGRIAFVATGRTEDLVRLLRQL